MVRVSCPLFAVIREGSYYGLIVAKKRKGEPERLVPIGGAVQADPNIISMIMADFGAPADSFETNSTDTLRFTVPEGKVTEVVDWFRMYAEWRGHRDMTDLLRTSLEKEAGVLTSAEIKSLQQRYLGYVRLEAPSLLTVREKHTLYLAQLFEVTPPPQLRDGKLAQLALRGDSPYQLVFAQDIREGVTAIGDNRRITIDPAAKALLMKPSSKLP